MKFFKGCYFAAVLAFTGLLSYMQISLLPSARNCILETKGIQALSSSGAIADGLIGCSSLTLEAVAAAIALLFAIIMLFGFAKGYFASAYGYLEKANREWVVAAVVVAAATLPYLARGNVVLGDAMQFSALSLYLKNSLASLSYPFWTFYWYMGSAPLAFYGWLYLLLAGIASLFTSIDAANKILFFFLHIGASIAAYAFVKTATGNSKAAVVAALVYGLSFEHIARIMVGRSITSLTYLLTPLLFLFYELRLNKKVGSCKAAALIALTASLLIFNHQADAVLIIAIFAIYAATRAIETGKENARKLAAEMAAAAAIAFIIVSFWAVPMLTEKGQASATGKALEIFELKSPDKGIAKEMVSWPGKWGDKRIYYIGISSLALAAAGLIYMARTRKFAAAAATISSITLLLVQSPRYAPVVLLMLGISAGYGFVYLSRKVKIESRTLLLIAAAIMIADMVPATLQLGYPDFSYNKQFYDSIHANGGERILDLPTDRRTFWPSYIYINNNAETVFGTLVESAPRSLPYAAAISQKAAQEIYAKQKGFSNETLQGFYMLGVKYVVVHNEQKGKNPEEVFANKKGALGTERGLEAIELNHSTIIIAAKKKTLIDYEPELEREEGWNMRQQFEARAINTSETDRVIEAMQIDTVKGTAAQILVKDGGNETIAADEDLDVRITQIKTEVGKVEINYGVSSDAFLQLSYSHTPYLSVRMDEKETEYWKTAINTIAVKTREGEHTITIEAKKSQLRKLLMPVSLAGLSLALFLLSRKNRKI